MNAQTVPELYEVLTARGVQLWHNRGRVFCGPIDLVSAQERALIHHHRAELIAYLKRLWPARANAYRLVAPSPHREAGWEGILSRKPWHYEVSVILPTLGPVDLLRAALACWRNQTISPYFVVIDTGSTEDCLRGLRKFRAPDCEIHYLGAHGWRHSSAPVAAALDLAFAVCQTDLALLTHTDVFPRSEGVLEELVDRCCPELPVLGYQMSRRQGSDEWLECVSHTLTVVDLRVMRRVRATWNLLTVLESDNEVDVRYQGWPDTETGFGRSLRVAGITPAFLGPEPNAPVYANDRIVHWRSAASLRQYAPKEEAARHPGLGLWLERTQELGVAAPLPELPCLESEG